MLNCVIVDDEQFSVDAILNYIKLIPRLKVVGIFLDPREAIEQIAGIENIDILFMDINMPNVSGIELANTLRSKVQKLVFTTSHSVYAFDAYEAEGDAYLLKPYTFAKFTATINRLFPLKKPESTKEDDIQKDYFLVKNKDEDLRIEHVSYNEVVVFESLNNYVKIYLTDNRTITSYLTIQDILNLLGARESFKQFHRSYVISTKHISFIASNMIKMNNNVTFPIGDRFKNDFLSYLSGNLAKTSRNKHSS